MSGSLIAGALINAVAAAVFIFVAFRFSRKQWPVEARWAGRAFVTWWLGFAGYLVLWVTMPMVLVVGDYTHLPVFLALLHTSMFLLCLGIGCLVYYFLYLLTGRRGLWIGVAVYYALVFIALVLVFVLHRPVEVAVHRWWVDLVYQVPLGTAFQVALAALVLPATLSALAHFSLVRHTRDKAMRVRIAVVSWIFIVWSIAGAVGRVLEVDLWQLILRTVVGLVVAVLVLLAYGTPRMTPPHRAQGPEWWAHQAPDVQQRPGSERGAIMRRRGQALERRMEELI